MGRDSPLGRTRELARPGTRHCSGANAQGISALDQLSYMPFLRNEFSKIFEGPFLAMKFQEMTHIYDGRKKIAKVELRIFF